MEVMGGISVQFVLGIMGGLVPIVVALIKRRPREKVLKRGDHPRGGGFSISGDYKRTDGTPARRLRLYNGRMVVEWEDGKMTDIPKMEVMRLLAFGPKGSLVIR